jgi:hypothetical protein
VETAAVDRERRPLAPKFSGKQGERAQALVREALEADGLAEELEGMVARCGNEGVSATEAVTDRLVGMSEACMWAARREHAVRRNPHARAQGAGGAYGRKKLWEGRLREALRWRRDGYDSWEVRQGMLWHPQARLRELLAWSGRNR